MRNSLCVAIVIFGMCLFASSCVHAQELSSKITIRHGLISMNVDNDFLNYLKAATNSTTSDYDLIGDYMYKKGKYYFKYEVVASVNSNIVKVFLYKFVDDIFGCTETINIPKNSINDVIYKISKGGYFSFD